MAWKSSFKVKFIYSGICLYPKPNLNLIIMENLFWLPFVCLFPHNFSVINDEKTVFFLISDCCLICKYISKEKATWAFSYLKSVTEWGKKKDTFKQKKIPQYLLDALLALGFKYS